MALLLRTHFKLAKTSIKENRTRSFLTCLGIAIGVASIILILSLMGSISNLIRSEVNEIGSDLIVVRPSSTKDSLTNIVEELTSANSFQNSSLATSDVSAIQEVEDVAAVAPIATSVNTVVSERNTFDSVPILGTTSDFIKIEPLTIRYGAFFNEQNEQNSVVLGHTLSLALFNTINSTVGKMVNIMGEKFMVVGVLDEVDKSINFDNVDFDNALIMNIERLDELTGSSQIQQINVKAVNIDALPSTSQNIENALLGQKLGDRNFTVVYGDEITHPAGSLFTIVSGMLAVVAAISLVVGGIGVMNIMLVSVTERTREIGIRKSLGAKTGVITMQFLTESIILCLIGGLIGVLLGVAGAFGACAIIDIQPKISIWLVLLALLFSSGVGLFFGIYPARKAAKLSPIDALRSE